MDDVKDQIPYYLTQKAGEGILKELENYSAHTPMFLTREMEGILQGDGWKGFCFFNHLTGNVQNVRAIVLSNSCDIDPGNARDLPAQVTFVPLMKLSKIEIVFRKAGHSEQAIQQKLRDIRAQRSTSFFFLPSQGVLDEDYAAWLSDAHSMPMKSFLDSEARQKVFTLNMTGFYLFLFKLSIHFCRFHEKVDRFPSGDGASMRE
ncbi:MAG TPA: hypothetical protein VGE28_12055 [Pseudomonas sp.]